MHNSPTSSDNSSLDDSSQQHPPAEPMIDKGADPKPKTPKKIKKRSVLLDEETSQPIVTDQENSPRIGEDVLSSASTKDHKESLYIYLKETLNSKNLSPYHKGMTTAHKKFAVYVEKENNPALLIILSKIVRGALQDSIVYFANSKEVEKLDLEIKFSLQLIINCMKKKLPQESFQESLIRQLKKADQFLFQCYPSNGLEAETRIIQYINQVLEKEKASSSNQEEPASSPSKMKLNPLLAEICPLLKYSPIDEHEFRKADGFCFNLFKFTKDHVKLLMVALRIITRTVIDTHRNIETEIQYASNQITLKKIQRILLSTYLESFRSEYLSSYKAIIIIDIGKYEDLIKLIVATNPTHEQRQQWIDDFFSISKKERNDKNFSLRKQKLNGDLIKFLQLTPDESTAAVPFVIMEIDTLETKNETETSSITQEQRRLKLFAKIIYQTIDVYNKKLNPPNATLERIVAKLTSQAGISEEDLNETLSMQISLTYQLFCKYQLMYFLSQHFLLTDAHHETDDEEAQDQNSDQLPLLDNEARLRILGLHENDHGDRVPVADIKLISTLIKNKLSTLCVLPSPFPLDEKEVEELSSCLSQDFQDVSVLNPVCGYLLTKTLIWSQRLEARFKALQTGAALIECELTTSAEIFQNHLQRYHCAEMSQACEKLENNLNWQFLSLFDRHCSPVAIGEDSRLAPELYELIGTILSEKLAALQFSDAKVILDQLQQLKQNKKFTEFNEIYREFDTLKNSISSSCFVTESVALAFNQAVLAFNLDQAHAILTAIKQKSKYSQLFSALQISNATDLDEKQNQTFLAVLQDDKDIIKKAEESEKLYKEIETVVIPKVKIRNIDLAEEVKLAGTINHQKRSTMAELDSKIAAHNNTVQLFKTWRQEVRNQSRLPIQLISEESKEESRMMPSPILNPSLPAIANLELKPLPSPPAAIAVPELKESTILSLLNLHATELTAANIALTAQNQNFEHTIITTTANINSNTSQLTTQVTDLKSYQTQLEIRQRKRLNDRRQAINDTSTAFNQIKSIKSNAFSEASSEEETKLPALVELPPVIEEMKLTHSSQREIHPDSLDQHLLALQSRQLTVNTNLRQYNSDLQTADQNLWREMTLFRDGLIPGDGNPHVLLDRLITQTRERIKEYDSISPFLTQSTRIGTKINEILEQDWRSADLTTQPLAAVTEAQNNSFWQGSYKKNVRVYLTRILILLQQLKNAPGHFDNNFGIITTLLNEYEQLVNPKTTSVWRYLCCCFGRKPPAHVKTDYTVAMEQDLDKVDDLKKKIIEQIGPVQFRLSH